MATLPEELHNQICWHLLWTLDQEGCISDYEVSCKTLFNLLLSSKTFHRLAHSVLYHTLVVGSPGRSRIGLLRLLELCVAFPEIASGVKHLDLSHEPHIDPSSPNVLSPRAISLATSLFGSLPSSPFASTLLSDLSRSGGEGEEEEEEKKKRGSSNDALATFILTLCTNLTFLELPRLSPKTPHLTSLIRSASPSHSSSSSSPPPLPSRADLPLQHVRDIRVSDREPRGGGGAFTALRSQMPILALPSLARFTGSAFCAAGEGRGRRYSLAAPPGFGPASSASLRRIELRRSAVDSVGVGALLRAFGGLVEVDVEVPPGFDDEARTSCRLDFANMGDVLRRCGGRLERFSLAADLTSAAGRGTTGEPMGGLGEMGRLRVLRVGWDALFGAGPLGGGGRDVGDAGRGGGCYAAYYSGADDPRYLVRVLPTSLRGLRIWDGPSGWRDDDLRAPHREIFAKQLAALTACEDFGELCTVVLTGLLGFGMGVPEGWQRVRSRGAYVMVKQGKEMAEGVLENSEVAMIREMERGRTKGSASAPSEEQRKIMEDIFRGHSKGE